MNKTKLYTSIVVVICFIGIGIGGIYNSFRSTSAPDIHDEVKEPEVSQKDESHDVNVQKEDSKSQNGSQKTDTPKKPEMKPEKPSTIPTKKPTEEKNQGQPEQVEKDPVKIIIKVNLTITGINETMGEDIVEVEEGKSGFDVLKKYCDQKNISLKTTGFGPIIYVSGINGLNEFDHGTQSGWIYQVNGVQLNKSSGAYKVKDGDSIEWIYKTAK